MEGREEEEKKAPGSPGRSTPSGKASEPGKSWAEVVREGFNVSRCNSESALSQIRDAEEDGSRQAGVQGEAEVQERNRGEDKEGWSTIFGKGLKRKMRSLSCSSSSSSLKQKALKINTEDDTDSNEDDVATDTNVIFSS
ncbi:hypothetical protein BsWGS_26013 [Bradybaena similaris]